MCNFTYNKLMIKLLVETISVALFFKYLFFSYYYIEFFSMIEVFLCHISRYRHWLSDSLK